MKFRNLILVGLLVLGGYHAARATIEDWTETAASNTNVAGTSIAEGMAPSGVNNAMREILQEVARFVKMGVSNTFAPDSGSADAYAISPAIIKSSSLVSGTVFSFQASGTNATGTPTLSVGGETGITIVSISGGALQVGDIQANAFHQVIYDGTNYRLLNPTQLTSGQLGSITVGADNIAANAITLSKIGQGPEGTLLTWNSSTEAVAITPGTTGQLLASRGASSTPVFQTQGFIARGTTVVLDPYATSYSALSAHNLDGAPQIIETALIAKSENCGYAAGTVLTANDGGVGSSANSGRGPWTIAKTITGIWLTTEANGAVVTNGSTNAVCSITAGSWSMHITPYYLNP